MSCKDEFPIGTRVEYVGYVGHVDTLVGKRGTVCAYDSDGDPTVRMDEPSDLLCTGWCQCTDNKHGYKTYASDIHEIFKKIDSLPDINTVLFSAIDSLDLEEE